MTRTIAFLIFPDFQLLDAAGPITVFEAAGRENPEQPAPNAQLRASIEETTLRTDALERALREHQYHPGNVRWRNWRWS